MLSTLVSNGFKMALRGDVKGIGLHLAFAAFVCLTFWKAVTHAPFADEAQAWLIARDTDAWTLLIMSRHEGHPLLWFLCLKALQAVGANYLGMMVLNWLFVAAGIWLLFYQSGLPLMARLVVAFVPICFFEIAFIARNYGIALFFCFLAAHFYRQVEIKPLRFAVALALLANTNVYAAAVFLGASGQFLLEQCYSFGRKPFSFRLIYTRYLGANAALVVGALLVVIALAPVQLPGDVVLRPALPLGWPKFMSALFALVYCLPVALICFGTLPGQPQVWGGLLTSFAALVPSMAYVCDRRHVFMLVLAVIYFSWIYLDRWVVGATFLGKKLSPLGVRMLVVSFILLACLGTTQRGLGMMRIQLDSQRAAQSIIDAGLDRPETLLVTTDPAAITPLFLFFHHLQRASGPPPFPNAPQSFTDSYYTMSLPAPTSLEQLRPLVLRLARENPSKTLVVITSEKYGTSDRPIQDPDYPLESLHEVTPNQSYPGQVGFHVYKLLKNRP